MNTLVQSVLARLFVVSLFFGTILVGCDSGPSKEGREGDSSTTTDVVDKTAVKSETVSSPANDMVRVLTRLPQFSLTNQAGEAIATSDLYGQVWIANFIFTRCQGSCPLQTAAMGELQKSLKKTYKWKDIRLVSISVDPEYDTPEVLTRYISDQKVDAAHWQFLTGERTDVWDLIKSGFKMPVADDAKNTEMPIMHSTQSVLVDWEGRIRGYYDVFTEEGLTSLKRDTALVVEERVPQPADVINPAWVQSRMQKQLKAATEYEVFHDFRFNDAILESGINFRHKIVDDAAIVYKAVHYDHGNAIAVADVDSDGLYDIYFTSQAGSNELWRNLGNGKFENITEDAGLMVDDRIGVGASFADIDNDGDPDLYITSVRVGNLLFENDGKGHFKDITEQSGTGAQAHSSGSVFFDFDRDGLLDLFVSNVGVYTTDKTSDVTLYTDQGQIVSDYKYNIGFKDAFAGHLKQGREEKSILFRNLGGNRFEDVSEKVNLVDTSWTGDAAVIDGNNDGWPDLYVLNMQGHDEYYENVDGQKFVRKSREIFPKTPWGAMGVKSFDYDNDGDMDIFVTDMHSDMSEEVLGEKEELKANMTYPESFLQSGGNSIFGNAFYRNDGDGKYVEISDEIGAENYWPWGLSSGDFNADGFEDVFIASSMNFPFRYSVNSLLLNNQGKEFLDSEYVLGVEPRKDGLTAAPWFELHCSEKDAGRQICGTAKGRKIVWGALGSRSSVIFDLDQDGDLDIVTLEFNQRPMMLISNLSDKKKLNYIKIDLVGTKSNRDGIGASVRVYAGDDMYTKMKDGKSGYLSRSLYPLYFGLGMHNKVDKIEVTWPSGMKQTVTDKITMNEKLEITEPQ